MQLASVRHALTDRVETLIARHEPPKRHRDLSRSRNQVTCRLHAAWCELVPGGVSREITAGQAARFPEQISLSGAVARARLELAGAAAIAWFSGKSPWQLHHCREVLCLPAGNPACQ